MNENDDDDINNIPVVCKRQSFPELSYISVAFIQLGKGKEMFYLTTHSTHYIYGYMATDIW